MSRSPVTSRRSLGVELRSLRESAGKKIEDAAVCLECSTAKISRLENGKGKPKIRDVRDLLELYGSTDAARNERLETLAADAQEQDWLSDYRDVIGGDAFADHLLRFLALERDCTVSKQFEADLVPGLLQTEEYIDAICRSVFPDLAARERARFVEFRRARQELLRAAEPPEMTFIVSEIALMRPIGGEAVKRRQLEQLHENLLGSLKAVDLRVLPLASAAPGGLGGPFAIIKFPDADQNVVYLEGREGATYLESPAAVIRYEEKFSALEAESMTREQSLERMLTEIGTARPA